MIVDELLIPDREGTIRIRLAERITVFAGMDAAGRARMVDLVAGALSGRGPGCARVRDALGRPGLVSAVGTRGEDGRVTPGPVPATFPSEDHLRRALVVTAADLGLDPAAPDPLLVAERTALAGAHRQLLGELAAIEAAAAEADRLAEELALAEGRGGAPAPEAAAARAALVAAAPAVDRLLHRRRAAEEERARLAADRAAGAGPDDGGTGVVAARAALRQVEALRRAVDDPDGDGPLGTALATEEAAARAVLRRAADDASARHDAVVRTLADLDAELAALAARLGVAVGADGPGPALARAVPGRLRPPPGAAGAGPGAAHREALRARIAELPTAEDVRAARLRVRIAADHLARRGGAEPPVEQVRNQLLGRAAALRPDGTAAVLPLVLDEPLVGLDPGTRCELLDVLARVADRAQVLVLTGDDVVRTWARHRAERGHARLVELAPAR